MKTLEEKMKEKCSLKDYFRADTSLNSKKKKNIKKKHTTKESLRTDIPSKEKKNEGKHCSRKISLKTDDIFSKGKKKKKHFYVSSITASNDCQLRVKITRKPTSMSKKRHKATPVKNRITDVGKNIDSISDPLDINNGYNQNTNDIMRTMPNPITTNALFQHSQHQNPSLGENQELADMQVPPSTTIVYPAPSFLTGPESIYAENYNQGEFLSSVNTFSENALNTSSVRSANFLANISTNVPIMNKGSREKSHLNNIDYSSSQWILNSPNIHSALRKYHEQVEFLGKELIHNAVEACSSNLNINSENLPGPLNQIPQNIMFSRAKNTFESVDVKGLETNIISPHLPSTLTDSPQTITHAGEQCFLNGAVEKYPVQSEHTRIEAIDMSDAVSPHSIFNSFNLHSASIQNSQRNCSREESELYNVDGCNLRSQIKSKFFQIIQDSAHQTIADSSSINSPNIPLLKQGNSSAEVNTVAEGMYLNSPILLSASSRNLMHIMHAKPETSEDYVDIKHSIEENALKYINTSSLDSTFCQEAYDEIQVISILSIIDLEEKPDIFLNACLKAIQNELSNSCDCHDQEFHYHLLKEAKGLLDNYGSFTNVSDNFLEGGKLLTIKEEFMNEKDTSKDQIPLCAHYDCMNILKYFTCCAMSATNTAKPVQITQTQITLPSQSLEMDTLTMLRHPEPCAPDIFSTSSTVIEDSSLYSSSLIDPAMMSSHLLQNHMHLEKPTNHIEENHNIPFEDCNSVQQNSLDVQQCLPVAQVLLQKLPESYLSLYSHGGTVSNGRKVLQVKQLHEQIPACTKSDYKASVSTLKRKRKVSCKTRPSFKKRKSDFLNNNKLLESSVSDHQTIKLPVAKTKIYFCMECGKSVDSSHFVKRFSCDSCKNSKFSTCCPTSFTQHRAQILFGRQMSYVSNAPFWHNHQDYIGQKWHCPCGFFSCKGNKLASHLVLCRKETCYSLRELHVRLYQEQIPPFKPN